MIGARKGSPLAIGYGDGEMYLGSDAIALAPFTDTISYLEDGDWAVLTRKGVEIHDAQGKIVERPVSQVDRLGAPGRQGQPPALHGQGNPRAAGSGRPHARALHRHGDASALYCRTELPFDWSKLKRLSISACGTAFYAGLVAKYWFERFAKLPVEIDIASEFRYREAPLDAGRSRHLHLAVGRDRRHAGDAALCQGAQAARAVGGQRADLDHRARKRRGDADAGRPRDRRRLDQGLHLPACGARLPGHRGRAARAANSRTATSRSWCMR